MAVLEVVAPAPENRINLFSNELGQIPVLSGMDNLVDLTSDRFHRLGPWVVVRLHRPCTLRRSHSESVTEEVKRLLFDVHHPRLLCIQRETESIKNPFGLAQIEVRLLTARNHKV